jgi:hypothetical protein
MLVFSKVSVLLNELPIFSAEVRREEQEEEVAEILYTGHTVLPGQVQDTQCCQDRYRIHSAARTGTGYTVLPGQVQDTQCCQDRYRIHSAARTGTGYTVLPGGTGYTVLPGQVQDTQ